MATDNDEDRNQRIQQRAYALWEAAGQPEGQDDHFWYVAERDIDAEAAGTAGAEDRRG